MARHPRRGEDADTPFTLEGGEGPGPRVQRLEHILFEELDRLFRLEVSDPRLSEVVPTSVQLSPDLRNAKVYFAFRTAPEEPVARGRGPARAPSKLEVAATLRGVQEGLLRVTPFLRARLADVVVMKRLPDLHFHRDRMAEASLRAAELLRTASGVAGSGGASPPSSSSGDGR